MGRFICYYDGMFFEWSTIVDAPSTYGMTREEFEEYYLELYGSSSKEDMLQRMQRAMEQGTSSMRGDTLEGLIAVNRAGPNEGRLSFDQLIRLLKEGEGL